MNIERAPLDREIAGFDRRRRLPCVHGRSIGLVAVPDVVALDPAPELDVLEEFDVRDDAEILRCRLGVDAVDFLGVNGSGGNEDRTRQGSGDRVGFDFVLFGIIPALL